MYPNRSKFRVAIIVLVLLAGLSNVPPTNTHGAATMELYGTFNAMGVIVSLTAGEDPDMDAVTNVEYRLSGNGAYQAGFPLTRVAADRFVGSLFWLEPGSTYDVRVSFTDPDWGPLQGVTVEETAATRAEIVIPAAGQTYYVTPSGSGTTCSLNVPCPLQEGLDQAQAGDEVVLRGGVYYQGDLSLAHSGTAGAPIVVRSYTGETAILDGADPMGFTWASQSNGIYHTVVNVADTFLVIANGERLLPYRSLADLQNLVWGVPGFFIDGFDLYVHLSGGADPNSASMIISRFSNAFFVDQDFIYFLNLTFRHYGVGECCPKAVYFYNASDNLIQGCTFAMNNLGIGLKYDSHRNVIQDNLFYDALFTWPWDSFYEGQVPYGGGGITFYSPADGRGTVIRRNTFHDFFDGFSACPDTTTAVTNETDVYENLVYNSGDDGMETDGRCSNVRIWRNTFHDVLMGISLAPVYDGPVYAIRNLIYRTGAGNNDYSGSAFKFNSGYDLSGPMYLFHNTGDAALTDPLSSGLDIKSPGSWTMITARNNIWSGTEFALSNANPSQPLDLDYDNLYTTLPGELAWWSDLIDRHLNTLAELQTATGQELHGMNHPPGFSNPGSGDYSLTSGSDLIDTGLVIPGINDDFNGAAPDVGAFEFTPSLVLKGAPGDQTIYLSWEVNTTLPLTATWTLDYVGTPGDQTPPIQEIPLGTSTYTLTGLTNYEWYTVTLKAMLGSTPILTDTVTVMPTDEIIYLPLILSK